MKLFLFLSPLLLFSLAACAPPSPQQQSAPPPSPPPTAEQAVPQGRVIPMTAELWKFTPNVIQVKQGEVVTLQVTGVSGTHGLAILGLGINEVILPGQIVSVRLPTANPGTYDFRCSIQCGSGHKDMTGQIIIEP